MRGSKGEIWNEDASFLSPFLPSSLPPSLPNRRRSPPTARDKILPPMNEEATLPSSLIGALSSEMPA